MQWSNDRLCVTVKQIFIFISESECPVQIWEAASQNHVSSEGNDYYFIFGEGVKVFVGWDMNLAWRDAYVTYRLHK